MRWLYTGVVRPALIYGAVVWWRVTKTPQYQQKLAQLTRLAVMTWGPIRRSTPTAALEILSYIPPIDLYLEGEVQKTWLRINTMRSETWDGIGDKGRGHRRTLQSLTSHLPLSSQQTEEIKSFNKYTRSYDVIPSDLNYNPPVKCHSEGLRLKGHAGVSYTIRVREHVVEEFSTPLGPNATLLQASAIACTLATLAVQKFTGLGDIVIFTSQQMVRLLDQPNFTKLTALMAALELDKLSEFQKTSIQPIKLISHERRHVRGLATKAASQDFDGRYEIPWTKKSLQVIINDDLKVKWDKRWNSLTIARQSRELWHRADEEASLELARVSRDLFGKLVGLITGHNFYRRHSHLLKEADRPICRLCGFSEETSLHLLVECPLLSTERLRMLGFDRADTMSQNGYDCSQTPYMSYSKSSHGLMVDSTRREY